MPTIGYEAGIVLLLLLPGFISARIVQSFCLGTTKRSDFDKVVDALIHTFFVAVLYAVTVKRLPLQVNSWTDGNKTHYAVDAVRWPLLWLLLIAVAWGALVMICNNLDVPWKWLRKLRVVHRSARNSVWHDSFYDYGDVSYVQVELSDGRFVLGYLQYYSDQPEDGCLFVGDASWIGYGQDGKTTVIPIPGPGILLTKSSGIVNVAFLNPQNEAAIEADTGINR
ncbi:MAG: DUF6338 family protein [Terriglobales bacterium]